MRFFYKRIEGTFYDPYRSYMYHLEGFFKVMDTDVAVAIFVKLVEYLAVFLGLLIGEADGDISHFMVYFVAHRLQEVTGFSCFKLEGERKGEGGGEGGKEGGEREDGREGGGREGESEGGRE